MSRTDRGFVFLSAALMSASCTIVSTQESKDAAVTAPPNDAAPVSDVGVSNDVTSDARVADDGGLDASRSIDASDAVDASDAADAMDHSDAAETSVDAEAGSIPHSGFDDSDDGWTVVGDAQTQTSKPDYDGMGGNPDGLISAKDDVAGGTWYFQAPAKYLGDQSPAYGGYLAFDLKTTDVSNPFEDYDVVLVGAGKVLVFDTPMNPATTGWTSYRIDLTETSGWREIATESTSFPADFASLPAPSQEEFKAVLADVTRLRIRGEFNDGADTGALDNVKLGAKN